MNQNFTDGFEKVAIDLSPITRKMRYLKYGPSVGNVFAKNKFEESIPYIGKSKILQAIVGGLHQRKVKNMDLVTLGKNMKTVGGELSALAKKHPGRTAAELGIGGGLLYAGHKAKQSNDEHKRRKAEQQSQY